MCQYHVFSVLFALIAGIGGLVASYLLGSSAGAAISLVLALIFLISFCLRKVRA
jgi:zinc transport system permease protein